MASRLPLLIPVEPAHSEDEADIERDHTHHNHVGVRPWLSAMLCFITFFHQWQYTTTVKMR
jgi:hypothetical protein